MSKKKTNRKNNIDDIKNQLQNAKTELKNGTFFFTGKMSIFEFANKTNLNANEIVKNFFLAGKLYNINHILEEEEIAQLCIENNFEFSKETKIDGTNFLDEISFEDKPEDLIKRAPIITIMGHVDHGKTSLIDKIRNSNITKSESSGITQHTGAYQIVHKNQKITFIDTPGHEAFSAMRARGANVTDIVVLVVAADDGVMPQTVEAIKHCKNANVPIIVFVNKMDKPNKDLDKLKGKLAENGVVIEEYGGSVQTAYGSALKNEGIKELFDEILLLCEVLDLKANPKRFPIGTVIESRVDKRIGALTTIIVQNGTLYKGDFLLVGSQYSKIRTLSDENGNAMDSIEPGCPAVVTGFKIPPTAGSKFVGINDEKFAKRLASEKNYQEKINNLYSLSNSNNNSGGKKVINVIIKSDTNGTAEAIKNQLEYLENDEAKIKVISSNVGDITENDLMLAKASDSIIFTFNLKVLPTIRENLKVKKITLISHNVIYKIIEDCKLILDEHVTPIYEEKKIGQAHVIKIFTYSKLGTIAGSMQDTGVVRLGAKVKVYRKNKLIHEGFVQTLKRNLNEVKEVEKGKDFGTHLKDFNNIEVDDVLEFYEDVRVN